MATHLNVRPASSASLFHNSFPIGQTIGSFLTQTEVAKASSVSKVWQLEMQASRKEYIEKILTLNPKTSFLAKFLTESRALPVDLTDANKQLLLTKKVVALMSNITGRFKGVFGLNPACKGTEISIDRLDLKMKLLEEISLNKVFKEIIEKIAPERRPQIELRTTIDPNKTIEANETEIKQAADSIRLWMKSEANPSLDDQQVPAESPLNAINSLDLQNLGLTNIPQELNFLPNLSSLDLSHNPIFFFPDYLRLPNLKELKLAYTSIEQLPNNLDICTPELDRLNLRETQLTSLPDNFNPPNLWSLDISGTKISCLPDNFNPPHLHSLDISGAKISRLPDNFNPPYLRSLDISGAKISRLPDNFNPPYLRSLDISGAKISRLPDNFNPPNLWRLDISGAKISRLPDNFNPPYLRSLDISGTKISCLPDNFNPPHLHSLDISGTKISSLPYNFNPPNLRSIDISGTEISSLPYNFDPPNLYYNRNIENIRFKDRLDLPPDFKMKLIEEINLNKVFKEIVEQIAPEKRPKIELRTKIAPYLATKTNEREIKQAAASIRLWMANAANTSPSPLDAITSLKISSLGLTNIPQELNFLSNLTTLHLNFNPISFFPHYLNLPKLTKLEVSHTLIEQLPNNLDICTPNLTSVYLSGTKLTSLPDCLSNLPRLTKIDALGAQLESLPENFNPPSLKELYIDSTNISRLPENFNPPSLKKLYIDSTNISRLPEHFNPSNLQHFSAQNTPLEEIPNSFRPPQLRSLNVSNTAIKDLRNICGPALYDLNLSHTKIEHLPTNWQPLNLRKMEIDNTRITSLPAALMMSLTGNPKLRYKAYKQISLNRLRMTAQNIQSLASQALSIRSLALSKIKEGLSYAPIKIKKIASQLQRRTTDKVNQLRNNIRLIPLAAVIAASFFESQRIG